MPRKRGHTHTVARSDTRSNEVTGNQEPSRAKCRLSCCSEVSDLLCASARTRCRSAVSQQRSPVMLRSFQIVSDRFRSFQIVSGFRLHDFQPCTSQRICCGHRFPGRHPDGALRTLWHQRQCLETQIPSSRLTKSEAAAS